MLSVQMAVHAVDYSFDLKESKPDKSVESDNLQDKKTFKNIFESAASDYNKSQNIKDAQGSKESAEKGKNPDPRIEDTEKNTSVKKVRAELNQNTEKLLSHKKNKPGPLKDQLKTQVKNEKKSITPVESQAAASISGKADGSAKLKSDDFKKPGEVDNTNAGIVSSEVQAGLSVSSHLSSSIPVSMEASARGISEKTRSSLTMESDKTERKEILKKKSSEKKEVSSDKGKISVLDLRASESSNQKAKHTAAVVEKESQKLMFEQSERVKSDSGNESKPIVIEMTQLKDNFSGESKTITTSSSSPLMKQLEESINNKIVKQSSVVLKDSGAGEIKLILKPEQLGNVRIKLTMQDNRISGNIIVDNAAVKEMFEQNMQNLERAFRENGFETANLNVSVGGDHTDSRGREKGNDIKKLIDMIDESIPSFYSESENLIDLIA